MTPAQFWQIEMQNQQNQQENMQAQQKQMMSAIGQFAGQYAENKALDAKGVAIGDFLKNHGEQLGLQGEYLDSLLKKKPREIAMESDALGLTGMGNRLMGLNHLNQQAALYPRSGAGGGGGSQKGYMPGQGWMGY